MPDMFYVHLKQWKCREDIQLKKSRNSVKSYFLSINCNGQQNVILLLCLKILYDSSINHFTLNFIPNDTEIHHQNCSWILTNYVVKPWLAIPNKTRPMEMARGWLECRRSTFVSPFYAQDFTALASLTL